MIQETGKTPPNALELEEVVIGALLLEPQHITTISTMIKPEYFYSEQHGLIFKAIIDLYNKREPIGTLEVVLKLRSTNELDFVGGAYFISSLIGKIASTVHVERNCLIIHEKFILRELIRLGTCIIKDAYEPGADCFEIINDYNKQTAELTNIISEKTKLVGEILNDVIDEIKLVQETGLPTGLMSGYTNIDKVTGGWQNSTLSVLAARPGMGKTALALALAKYPAIELKKPVAIFSLEMSAKQLVGRLAASESDISSSKINQKSIDSRELMQIGARCHRLVDAPIYIDDTASLRFSDLRSKAKKLFYENKIELIIIDYLQLMHGDEKGNREQEISYISRNLKALSKELDIPIIALSQLSRTVETRTGQDAKRPQLSDLRESGAIEQDADNVMFLFRPEYYDMFPEGYAYGNRSLNTQNLMLLDFAKGRELKICEVPLKFYGEFMRVDNYDLEPPAPSPLDSNNNFLEDKF